MYWMTGFLGFALMVAPFMFGYADNSFALWTSVLVGLATLVLSWMEGAQNNSQSWEYWTVGILGIVAIIAPFVMGFGYLTEALWSSIILGILIAFFAGAKLSMGVGHKVRMYK